MIKITTHEDELYAFVTKVQKVLASIEETHTNMTNMNETPLTKHYHTKKIIHNWFLRDGNI